jgi:hypothetical protein
MQHGKPYVADGTNVQPGTREGISCRAGLTPAGGPCLCTAHGIRHLPTEAGKSKLVPTRVVRDGRDSERMDLQHERRFVASTRAQRRSSGVDRRRTSCRESSDRA